MELRNYQKKAVEKLQKNYEDKKKNSLLWLPTGTGKTEIAIQFFKQNQGYNFDRRKGGLFIMHRKNLTLQTYERFFKALNSHVNIGLVLANLTTTLSNKTHFICSADTLKRRPELTQALADKTAFAFIDEAHDATSKGYKKLLKNFDNHFVVGMTATPYKINGRYHSFWSQETIVNPITLPTAVLMGYLCPMKFYVPKVNINKAELVTRGGDYTTDSLFKATDKADIYGDFEKYFKQYGLNRNTITFCVNIAHSKKIADIIQKIGGQNLFRVDHHLSHNEQVKIKKQIKKLASENKNFHIVNVNMFSTGIDIPSLQVGFFLRKTKSLVLWDQQIGRLTRIHPNKKTALAFDFTENTIVHGTPYTHTRKPDLFGTDKKEKEPNALKVCPNCFLQVTIQSKSCPSCGLVFKEIAGPAPLPTEEKQTDLVDFNLLLKSQKKASVYFDLSGFNSV